MNERREMDEPVECTYVCMYAKQFSRNSQETETIQLCNEVPLPELLPMKVEEGVMFQEISIDTGKMNHSPSCTNYSNLQNTE